MSSTLRTKAIVLRRTNYGEADRILQLLTPENGKISAIAKSVRREKSKLAGAIELFAVCDVTISTGKGDLGILTGARLDTFYGSILQDYDRLQFGYDAIKQITKAAETVDDPAFYELLHHTFVCLNTLSLDLRLTRAWFFLQLAILLGVGLNLATDTSGMKLVEDAKYNFAESESGFVFKESGRFSSDHIKLLRILSAQSPEVAQHVQGVDKLIDDCLWIAERAIAH